MPLGSTDVSRFITDGFIRIENAFARSLADTAREILWRAESLKSFKGIATEHVNGGKIYMGDIHGAARSFARSHLVAPGNPHYLQSLDEYTKKRAEKR